MNEKINYVLEYFSDKNIRFDMVLNHGVLQFISEDEIFLKDFDNFEFDSHICFRINYNMDCNIIKKIWYDNNVYNNHGNEKILKYLSGNYIKTGTGLVTNKIKEIELYDVPWDKFDYMKVKILL